MLSSSEVCGELFGALRAKGNKYKGSSGGPFYKESEVFFLELAAEQA